VRATRLAALASGALVLFLATSAVAPAAAQAQCFATAVARNVSFCGGPVMHSQRVHLIYWDPAGSGLSFEAGYEQTIDTFVTRVVAADHSTNNLFGLMGQYGDGGGPAAYDVSFTAPLTDSDAAPTGAEDTCTEPPAPPLGTGPPGWDLCVSDGGIQSELMHLVRADRLPTGLEDVYFVITPDGFGSCFNSGPLDCADGGDANSGYCGYHTATGNPGIVYAVIPYNALAGHCQSTNPRPNASTADPAISTISHELSESATDPLGDAWSDDSGNEIADLCITDYGRALGGTGSGRWDETIDGGHYWIQELWSNHAHACEPRAKPDRVSFKVVARVRPSSGGGSLVTFSARAADPQGKVVSYSWTFGDGRTRTVRATRVSHRYARSASYAVKLRITDSWGNWAFATGRVRVAHVPRTVRVEAGRGGSRRAAEPGPPRENTR
jgi:hypothetical protein